MLKHNFLLIYRNFKRFKSTFFINLVGLSSGLTCVLLIYLWVKDELQVDKFHEHDAQLYQIMKNNAESAEIETDEDTPGLLAHTLAEEMVEIEKSVAVFPPAAHTVNGILTFGDTHIKAKAKFADKEFFNVFSHRLIHGSKDHVLADKYAVVISEKTAYRMFGSADNAVGKTLEWKSDFPGGNFIVSGVFENVPPGASIQFDFVISLDFLRDKFTHFQSWQSNNCNTYALLREHTDIKQFNKKIEGFIKSKYKDSQLTLFARPYSDRYLFGHYENGMQAGGRIDYVKMFSVIAIVILLIACINFMNLSTAGAAARVKEVGIKKAVGASRKTLIYQYLGESMLTVLVSALLALLLVDLILPEFNILTGKQLALRPGADLILSFFAIVIITGLMAGSYPALYLSRFSPSAILKGRVVTIRHANSTQERWARGGLVIFQFAISVVLMMSVPVVYQQMQYMQSKNLGFDRNNIITFTTEGKISEEPEAFIAALKKIPGIVNASYMDGDLVELHGGTTAVDWDGKKPEYSVDFELLGIGYGLIETLDIDLKEGRTFSLEHQAENSKIIFNEAAIESMGLTDPIGQKVKVWGEEKEIIGVVRNFHFESLYENVKPLFFRLTEKDVYNVIVKVEAGTEKETLAQLEKFYEQYNLGIAFEYRFLDEAYHQLYAAENRVAVLSGFFAALAILLSSLGLLGLAAFTAGRRTKEIGIRKVLGSSELGIILLLSGDFTRIVFIAILIASPVSYLVIRTWLDGFAYRIDLHWGYFVSSAVLALLIAWFTVGIQARKAARVNPAHCLKDE